MGEKIGKNLKSIIALDTNVFIYFFEKNNRFFPKIEKIFQSIEDGKCRGISSIITLIEILTLPKKKNDYLLVKEYSEILRHFPNFKFLEVDWEIANLASSLRAKYNLTTPDAIQIATALYYRADYFLTADKIFRKIKEVKVLFLK